MKVFITKREPHPVRFDDLNWGDCFHYENSEYEENFIAMFSSIDNCYHAIDLSDGGIRFVSPEALVHKVEVKIVNEV